MSRSDTFRIIAFLLLFLAWQAVTIARPVNNADAGWLQNWLVLGPFANAADEDSFSQFVEGMAKFSPKTGAVFITGEGIRCTGNPFTPGKMWLISTRYWQAAT